MKDSSTGPLRIAIHGMDARSHKMMVMFLQGPCKGNAVVVTEDEAEAEIIDADARNAKSILEARKQMHPQRPLIVLSLQTLSLENVIFVKKPVKTLQMQEALKQARQVIYNNLKKTELKKRAEQSFAARRESDDRPMITKTDEPVKADTRQDEGKKIYVNTDEQHKTSKHKTAMYMDEKSFSSYIGIAAGIDYTDPEQVRSATYSAKSFYQGYVQSAYKMAVSKNRALQLNSGWKPLVIYPDTRDIWLDADDKQLRAFSAVPITSIASGDAQGISVTPVDGSTESRSRDLEKFQSMDAFVWKLAIWTSKGRYPEGIDIDRPVYLKRWPNFTRLIIPPHSLRITALLIDGPRTLTNVAEVLQIKPQYVFAFFSAAYAMGLAGQAERKADQMIAPAPVKHSKKKGVLSRIMRKLRGNKN